MLLDLFAWRSYAPSGMRRLMMYQLQEADLQKRQDKLIKAAVDEVVKPKRKRKLEPEVEMFEPEPLPPFKLKPTVPQAPFVLPPIWLLSMEMQMTLTQIIPLQITVLKQRLVCQLEQAFEEFNRRFLLLAA